MVRLKDIAEAAGVSTGTVSAALSGTGRIGIHTREQIRKLAGGMNYQPSSGARMLRKKTAIDAGMVIADEQTRYTASPIFSVQRPNRGSGRPVPRRRILRHARTAGRHRPGIRLVRTRFR